MVCHHQLQFLLVIDNQRGFWSHDVSYNTVITCMLEVSFSNYVFSLQITLKWKDGSVPRFNVVIVRDNYSGKYKYAYLLLEAPLSKLTITVVVSAVATVYDLPGVHRHIPILKHHCDNHNSSQQDYSDLRNFLSLVPSSCPTAYWLHKDFSLDSTTIHRTPCICFNKYKELFDWMR